VSTRESEDYPFVVLAGLVAIPIVAVLCARLGGPPVKGQVFLVYLIPQLCLLALAVAVRRQPGFLIGVLLGIAVTTSFFGYLFMAVPSVLLGITVAHLLLKHRGLHRISTVVAFLCTTPFTWFVLYTEYARSGQ
jgi:hypothetical protein